MADKIISVNQKDDAHEFVFEFEDGNGNSFKKSITSYGVADMVEAKEAVLQTAADAKQIWLDSMKKSAILGDVVLPSPTVATPVDVVEN